MEFSNPEHWAKISKAFIIEPSSFWWCVRIPVSNGVRCLEGYLSGGFYAKTKRLCCYWGLVMVKQCCNIWSRIMWEKRVWRLPGCREVWTLSTKRYCISWIRVYSETLVEEVRDGVLRRSHNSFQMKQKVL